MQVSIVLLVLLGIGLAAKSQTFSEWWRQKKTRLKYLRQQAVALESLEKTVENGYETAKNGINSIRYIRDKEYQGHLTYFQSLCQASPLYKDDPEIAIAMVLEKEVIKVLDSRLPVYATSPFLEGIERVALIQEFKALTESVEEDTKELISLSGGSQWIMDDGLRKTALRSVIDHISETYKLLAGDIMMVDNMIEERKQQVANDEFLKKVIS